MSDKNETQSKSWADETEDLEEEPRRVTNAWANGNPYGIPPPTVIEDSRLDSYEREYPGKEPTKEPNNYQGGRYPERGFTKRDRAYPRDEPRNQREFTNERGHRGERREYHGYDERERRNDREDRSWGRDRDRYPPRKDYRRGPREPRESREPRERNYEREPAPLPSSPPYTAFVGNLPFHAVQDDLIQFFARDCKVQSVRLVSGKDGRAKGYGYVEFETLEDLKGAIGRNGDSLFDRPLRIDAAEAKQEDKRRNREETHGENRPKLDLKPRSVDRAASPTPSDAYQQSNKSNPFGGAKPRDENEILRKKEEERKKREQKGFEPRRNEDREDRERRERPERERRERREGRDRSRREDRNRDGRRDDRRDRPNEKRDERRDRDDKPKEPFGQKKESQTKALEVTSRNPFTALETEDE